MAFMANHLCFTWLGISSLAFINMCMYWKSARTIYKSGMNFLSGFTRKNKQLYEKIDKSGPMLLSPWEVFMCQLAVYTRMSILSWAVCVPVSVHVTDLVLACLLWAGYDEKGCIAERGFIIHAALWKAKGHDVSESPFDLMNLHPPVLKEPTGDSLTR